MTYEVGVTVCIPTIPPRRELLDRALRSVWAQSSPVTAVSIAHDARGEGAWATRNRALAMVRTEWTLFLDDDDELLQHCVETLLGVAESESADVVWGWFAVVGGSDPFPHYRGRQFDPANPHVIPITYLARTRLLHDALDACGGFGEDTTGVWEVQDMPIVMHMHAQGARFHAVPDVLWKWHHHGKNTSGLPRRWKGK